MTPVYDSRTVGLHWITAGLVLCLWVIGQCIDFFPKGLPRMGARSAHMAIGATLTVVLIARIAWRVRGGVKLPPSDPGVPGKLAVGVHFLLYGLLIAAVLMGMTSVWVRGDTFFNLFTVPAFDPGNKELREDVVDLHGTIANALLILAGLHAAFALLHHWVLKDGVLLRMASGNIHQGRVVVTEKTKRGAPE
jgi:cytochrome b561